MAYKTILYDVSERIATVTVNRPEQMNSITDELTGELHDAMQSAGRDKAVRVIILTGAGRAFCAGGDISGFGNQTPQDLITKLPRMFDMNRRPDFQTRHSYFPDIGKPIIGMLNGATAGLGLLYALFCDVRIAAEDAVFTTAFARRGLGAEYGMAWILAKVVGHANALDLLLSGRKLKGNEAMRLGLVNQVHPADQLPKATRDYALDMAEWCSPAAMRMMKAQVYAVPFQTLPEAVMMANRDMLVSNVSPDFKEGTTSFREKRPPRFHDE
jgi:enoyl-CoA hydratase/carnithine racemase